MSQSQKQSKPVYDIDPFAGDFSQDRTAPPLPEWAILHWHGGIPSPGGNSNATKAGGGFFIEDTHLESLGLSLGEPFAPFEKVALPIGGRMVPGWGTPRLELAILFADFSREDRDTARLRFPPEEYNRRKIAAPGSERNLRGHTRVLVAVRPLLREGIAHPLLLSLSGTYSAHFNQIIKSVGNMSEEATRLRKRTGQDGAVPREAFWVHVHAGANGNTALPHATIPPALTREFLVQRLVEAEHRRVGGTFDRWAKAYAEAWQQTVRLAPAPESTLPYVDTVTGEIHNDPPAPRLTAPTDTLTKARAITIAQNTLRELVAKHANVQYGRGAALPQTISGVHILIRNHGWDNPAAILPEIAFYLLGVRLDSSRRLIEGEAKALTEYLSYPDTTRILDAIWGAPSPPANVVNYSSPYANP